MKKKYAYRRTHTATELVEKILSFIGGRKAQFHFVILPALCGNALPSQCHRSTTRFLLEEHVYMISEPLKLV